jgi:hypothetical protein
MKRLLPALATMAILAGSTLPAWAGTPVSTQVRQRVAASNERAEPFFYNARPVAAAARVNSHGHQHSGVSGRAGFPAGTTFVVYPPYSFTSYSGQFYSSGYSGRPVYGNPANSFAPAGALFGPGAIFGW